MITKEEKDRILESIADIRQLYADDCLNHIALENGKIAGADYMLSKFVEVLRIKDEENQ